MQPAFAAGRASHNGTAFNARPVGAVSTAKLLIQNPQWSTGLLPRRLAISPNAEPLAVKTAPTRQCTPVGAVSTAKLWIQNPQWSAGFCRDRLRYPPPPNHSRSRQLPHVKCTPRGSGLDREAFDPKPTMKHRAITETACAISRRRTTRGQDRSHTSMRAPWERSRPRSF